MRRSLVRLVSIALFGIAVGGVAPASAGASRLARLATPSPSTAGDLVVISGRLLGRHHAYVTVVLWHRLPWQRRAHRVLRTLTDASGRYAFVRPRGMVMTNRRWFVTARRLRSGTVRERVHARVTLSASNTSPTVGETVTFSGHVSPSHAGQPIRLEQFAAGDWRVIATARIVASSSFA